MDDHYDPELHLHKDDTTTTDTCSIYREVK
jgi:hypothetical protein